MFGDDDSPLYPMVPLRELTDVCSGGTPDRKTLSFWNGTIPWVKTTELQNDVLYEIEEFITEQGLKESAAKMVPAGTILIAMYGQGKTRGMTAMLGREACTNQACACILPTSMINMTFLWKYFILSYEKLRSLSKGSNQANLNAGQIKDFLIPIPPKGMQRQFESFVVQTDKSKFTCALQEKMLNVASKVTISYGNMIQSY